MDIPGSCLNAFFIFSLIPNLTKPIPSNHQLAGACWNIHGLTINIPISKLPDYILSGACLPYNVRLHRVTTKRLWAFTKLTTKHSHESTLHNTHVSTQTHSCQPNDSNRLLLQRTHQPLVALILTLTPQHCASNHTTVSRLLLKRYNLFSIHHSTFQVQQQTSHSPSLLPSQ